MFFYLRSSLRSLRTNLRFTINNITGFAFAISVCLGIALYLNKEHSYDRYNTNFERIVRLIDSRNNSSLIDYRVKNIIQSNFPEI